MPPATAFTRYHNQKLADAAERCAFSLNMNIRTHIWYLLLFLLLFIVYLFDFSSNIFGLELYDVLLTHSRPLLPCASAIFIYKLVYTK